MSDLHRNSRFLRFLRSICAKTACARRAIVALFVVVATILATFMIMPSASMGASQQGESSQVQTQNGNAENKTAADKDNKAPAKNGSAVSDETAAKGEVAANSKAEESKTEHKNPQTSSNPDASGSGAAQNVDSEKKQNPAVGDKKDAKEAKKEEPAKKSNRQKREARDDDRAATGNFQLPQECNDAGITELAKCYVAEYFHTIQRKKRVTIKKSIKINNPDESYTIKPVFRRVTKINNNGIPTIDEKTDASSSVKDLIESFSLERLSTESTVLESNVENDDFVKVNPKTGEIKIHANKWLNNGSYYVFVKVNYKDGSTLTRSQWCTNGCKPSYDKYSRFTINVQYKVPTSNDLSLKVYNHQESKDRTEVNDNDTAATIESDENGNFSSIKKPIFIDTTSSKMPNHIYHRMICHKDGDETKGSDYYLNSINGLTLSDSATPAGGSTSHNPPPTQKRWDPAPGERPGEESAKPYTVYENDPFTERSQSWITGTPKEAGTFTCKVLALKNVSASVTDKHIHATFVQVFDNKINDSSTNLKQNLFDDKVEVEKIFSAYVSEADANARGGLEPNPYGIFGTTYDRKKVWDVKTIKIVVNSNKKQKLEVGDNDLKLNVYPFKSDDAGSSKPGASAPSALADGDTVSVMKGMELKPFIEATSDADSQKAITLKLLCSKGEQPQKNKAGDASDTSNSGGTGSEVAAGGASNASKTGDADPVYTKWEEPSKLGFTFPETQNSCTSEKDTQKCSLEGSTKNFAATTNVSATFKSAEAGDYQCVVFALKPKALTKFDALTGDATQSGSLTPELIKSKLTDATPTAFKENKDFAAFTLNIHSVSNFTLPHTGEWNWNLQLGAIAAVMVSVLAAGFVASQNDAYRKLFYERRRC